MNARLLLSELEALNSFGARHVGEHLAGMRLEPAPSFAEEAAARARSSITSPRSPSQRRKRSPM